MNISEYHGICKKLLAYAIRLTRHREDAEDLVGDTMLKGWRNRDKFRGDAALTTWLITIMRNRHFELRKQGALRHDIDERVSQEPESYADRAMLSRQCDEMALALETLEPRYARALDLHVYGGLEYSEIAEQEGIPIGTVRSRIFRAREQLEDAL
jgi:RNA polymerase sigma-70 factor (ECF subfamily)